jgi:cold-inducible RNA-binding protein
MSTKLYVGNLSFDTTETDLKDLFSQAGTVSEAVVINDKMTGRSRGFGFVTMSDAEGARAATSKFNGMDLHGRNLTVNEAKERESGGGGRGGSGGDRRPARRY